MLEIADVGQDPRLAAAAAAARETGIGSALAVPLMARGDVVGLLAAYPAGRPAAGEHETALLAALAGQLAVAVQNAQLHEQATRLGEEREAALAAERAAAGRMRALYEVSRSFAQSLRLDETLEALARTVVEVLDIDAAVVRMPDERREQLVPRAVHIREAPFAEPVRAILAQPVPFGQRNVQRLFRERRAFRLGRVATAGSNTCRRSCRFSRRAGRRPIVPVALPTEVVASLGVYSFRPGSPLSQETIEAATALAAQAALAIDNARLYQQQKQFADTMQRSLLPRVAARGRGAGGRRGVRAVGARRCRRRRLRLPRARRRAACRRARGRDGARRRRDRRHGDGEVRLPLARARACGAGRLPRLRERRDLQRDRPGQVHQHELRRRRRRAAAGSRRASAGHPAPRIVLPDGSARPLEAHGLVLGIDGGQEYAESHAELLPGSSLVLYTDGVVEARRNGELYGDDRLDALLAERHDLSAPRSPPRSPRTRGSSPAATSPTTSPSS